jgi:hypothetical protein
MEEPNRIGLTQQTNGYLEELLENLNLFDGEDSGKLYKLDLYRLALSIGLKKGRIPDPLDETSVGRLRVIELDPNGVIKAAVENSMNIPDGVPTYNFLERLAEKEISDMYDYDQKYGELPLEGYFGEE